MRNIEFTRYFWLTILLSYILPVSAAEIEFHYDSPEQISAVREYYETQPEQWFESEIKAGGAGSFKTAERGRGFHERFTEDWPEGVLTLWVYDDYFDVIDSWNWHHVNFDLGREVDGEMKHFRCEIRRYRDGWRADLNDPSTDIRFYPVPDGPNHPGWTRFDIVNPSGAGAQPFTIYIDGHKAFTTAGAFDTIKAVSTDWLPYIDEFSYSSQASDFRPNPVRSILPDNPYALVCLEPGENLEVPLSLNPQGASGPGGQLRVRLEDGRGETVATNQVAIDWKQLTKNSVIVDLSSPPRSGYFWLETQFQATEDSPVELTRRKINVQFLAPELSEAASESLDLFRRAWDFMPVGQIEGKNMNDIRSTVPAAELLVAPSSPPQDWSDAYSLVGPWINTVDYFNLRFPCHAGWYRQEVAVPADWEGQRIMLEIEGPESRATVFVDGQRVGEIEQPGGYLDLSAGAIPGQTFDLSIYVVADPNAGYYRLGREYLGEVVQVPASLYRRGLSGDVILFPQPKGARVDDVAIMTSVKSDTLTANFELSGLTPGKSYRLKAAATDAGIVAQALPETDFVAESETQTVVLSAEWKEPILWDLNKPYLYDLSAVLLDLKGQPIDYMEPERFGFREITADGPDLTLNGRPITLFRTGGHIGDAPAHSQWCEKYGFDAFGYGYGNRSARILDEAGKTFTGEYQRSQIATLVALDYAKSGQTDVPEFWQGVQSMVEYQIKGSRNSPGKFFHYGPLGGGRNGNGGMYNPLFQNGTWVNERRGNEVSMRGLDAGRRIKEMIHQIDPSRLVTAQDSGSLNDTMHITEYAGFQPIQEFIERTEYWRQFGTKPFLISEQAAPMFPNWTDALAQGKGWRGVPCFAEWTSIAYGDQAFERTELDEEYLNLLEQEVARKRAKLAETTSDPLEFAMKLKKIRMEMNSFFYMDRDEVLHNILWKDRMRDQIFHWRLNNLGMLGFWFSNFGPTMDDCYLEFQRPVTGFLAGTEQQPTLQTHIFSPEESLQRSAVLLNNSAEAAPLTCKWSVELNGVIVAHGERAETVPPGGKVFVPIEAVMPASTVDQSGYISVDFIENGELIRSDRTAISLVVPRTFTNRAKVALVDPEGDTAMALRSVGVDFQVLNFDEDFFAFDTIIFGRRAFDYEYALLPEGLDLGALTRQGKRILIMEQSEDALRERFKLRTEYLSPRHVYGRIGGHPVLDGLSDSLLTNWRGAASLTDGYEVSRQRGRIGEHGEFGNGGTWLYRWNDGELHHRPMKWGNTHNVATVTIMKPDTGGFRSLIDCGYGANFAAAWELDTEGSRIVFNQLDVSGRTEADPAAERYLQNLVGYVAEMTPPVLKQAVYLGGDAMAEELRMIDVPMARISAPADADPEKHILILGDASIEELQAWKDAIAQFAAAGGSIFSLPRSEADFAAKWTPFEVTAAMQTVNHTVVGKPSQAVLAGIGNSDLYWKGNIDVVSIREIQSDADQWILDTGVLAEVDYGQGRYVFCQIVPGMFGDISLDHWLKPSKYGTERMLRTLLSNTGVAMNAPRLLEQPKAKEELDRKISLVGEWMVCPAGLDDTVCPDERDADWRPIELPGDPQLSYPEWKGTAGAFWFRRELNLEAPLTSEETFRLEIGRISGADTVYINGDQAAFTNSETNVNSVSTIARDYRIPAKLLNQGVNQIAIHVEYESNAALGMKGSTAAIYTPMELKIYRTKSESSMPDPIELASHSEWWGHPVDSVDEPWNHQIRQRVAVPGMIQPQRAEWSQLTGYFWYWYQFELDEPLPDNAEPVLMLGAVDDEDTTYINNVKIGHTGKDTNPDDYWAAPRAYPIPKEILKVGKNIIQIQLNDFNIGGGISKGPVQIVFEDPEVRLRRQLDERPYLHLVDRTDDAYWHHGF
ncbi:hypothetical protein SH580_19330 [Coraliomargarita algicola]|uniref:Glycoside hydrolase family 2 immunoglobulin-like beta-sandwich domain-containing protein n=1 Tax=Coraliomargarita algicola TaxID=3092156 RepID=A0ABZ0RJY4_9BACT|nr:hypothetical protein [Coraliomargarita sp. J2-16]WPJ95574.1 hypothetical protein SH580_19330 [Coraliomargarita sp. J2-16]